MEDRNNIQKSKLIGCGWGMKTPAFLTNFWLPKEDEI